MLAAAVTAAGMSAIVIVIVVVAVHVGVIAQRAAKVCLYGAVGIARASAVKLYSCLGKRHLCASAYSSAYEHVNAAARKETCKRAVSAALRAYNFRRYDVSVLDFIYLEIFGMSEVLENLSVLICNCNLHFITP